MKWVFCQNIFDNMNYENKSPINLELCFSVYKCQEERTFTIRFKSVNENIYDDWYFIREKDRDSEYQRILDIIKE